MDESKKSCMHFSLRDLFWLVLVIAVAIGWWRDRTTQAARWHKTIKDAEAKKVSLAYREAEIRTAFAQSEGYLRSKLREFARLEFAIGQLDRETQMRILEATAKSPQFEGIEPFDGFRISD